MLTAHSLSSPLGRITISSDVLAQIVAHVTSESYGVVGLAGRPGLAGGVGRLLPRTRATNGISVRGSADGLVVELYVVVEYGLNLAEVGATVRSRVAYELERLAGLPVASVEVHIQDVRRSA
jgi:uncharacterized alkaline shock family protein YloU